MRILHVAESVFGGCGTYLNELVPLQLDDLGYDNIRVVVPCQHISHLASVAGSAMLPFQRKSRQLAFFILSSLQYKRFLICVLTLSTLIQVLRVLL